MDILTILGLLLSFIAIIGGNLLEGGHTESLIQLTAFIIVVGGTVGAVLVQTSWTTFIHALKQIKWVIFPPRVDYDEEIAKIVSWATVARKEGLLGLEMIADEEEDLFSAKGLLLLVDGSEPDYIRTMLEVDISTLEFREMSAAKVYEGLGGYSPTIGIIGAVMGLIHVMNNLADPNQLGPGIAVAFVATIYGVGLANMVFLPIASKLQNIVKRRISEKEMVMEGIISIAEGDNPKNIEIKLQGYKL